MRKTVKQLKIKDSSLNNQLREGKCLVFHSKKQNNIEKIENLSDYAYKIICGVQKPL